MCQLCVTWEATGANCTGGTPQVGLPGVQRDARTLIIVSGRIVDRSAIRAIVLDENDRILLIRTPADDEGTLLWLTPGGGIEAGEAEIEALQRELFEEIGVADASVGPCVWIRSHEFQWNQVWRRAIERFHVVRVSVDQLGLGAPELHEVDAPRRWFSVDGSASRSLPTLRKRSYPER